MFTFYPKGVQAEACRRVLYQPLGKVKDGGILPPPPALDKGMRFLKQPSKMSS